MPFTVNELRNHSMTYIESVVDFQCRVRKGFYHGTVQWCLERARENRMIEVRQQPAVTRCGDMVVWKRGGSEARRGGSRIGGRVWGRAGEERRLGGRWVFVAQLDIGDSVAFAGATKPVLRIFRDTEFSQRWGEHSDQYRASDGFAVFPADYEDLVSEIAVSDIELQEGVLLRGDERSSSDLKFSERWIECTKIGGVAPRDLEGRIGKSEAYLAVLYSWAPHHANEWPWVNVRETAAGDEARFSLEIGDCGGIALIRDISGLVRAVRVSV